MGPRKQGACIDLVCGFVVSENSIVRLSYGLTHASAHTLNHRCNRCWKWTWATKLRTWPTFSKRSTVSWTARTCTPSRLHSLQYTRSMETMCKRRPIHNLIHRRIFAPTRLPPHMRPRQWRRHRVWKRRFRCPRLSSNLLSLSTSGTTLRASSLLLNPQEAVPRLLRDPLRMKYDTRHSRQYSRRQRWHRRALCIPMPPRVYLNEGCQDTMRGPRRPTELKSGCLMVGLPR